MVKSVSSGRGFVNDAMVVQWDPFGEIVQTEVDGWNVVECADIDSTENSTFLSKICQTQTCGLKKNIRKKR